MAFVHALPLLAFALAQAEEPHLPPAAGPAQPQAQVQVPLAPPGDAGPPEDEAPAKPPPPMKVQVGSPVLRLGRPSRCLDRDAGGRWRAQCDERTKTCLVAPEGELDAEGLPVTALDRIPACEKPALREAELVAQGYAIVAALAETPPGWRRDERQRIMQVNFDLNRNVWLGAGWSFGGLPGAGGQVDGGIRWDFPFRLLRAPAMARVHALETRASFDGDLVDVTAASFDFSRAYPSPLLRLTTFVGRARRFDPPLYAGAWIEAAHLETIRTDAGWYDRLEVGAAALTLDLFRSRDLCSFVRLRGGAGYEMVEQLGGGAWVPHAAIDADVLLDRDGFRHLRLSVAHEWILPTEKDGYQPTDPAQARLPSSRTRFTGRAELEWILLAVNDQPVSTVLGVRAWKRNDVPGLPQTMELQGTASLRVNLWAPARRDAGKQEKL